ncbi:uncharacterized protein LOC107272602 isoform X2 [Cephus cinctus]|uniref:Uncharacterized protein LOC107272602 isoform X2 n=1 Tax=Cephus cinctus TaxID=211228 RepID=A0AAJ7FS10_CEPCN|nr:uncharacterized protein LOC107272602 isoform X2 [Cephus cinctus]
MSEKDKGQDHEAYTKLSLPKFLEGEEDAEVTWEIITKRYPNLAPLLREMETAISRAESLLQELKSPYTHILGSSSTLQISDSMEEIYPDRILSSYQSQGVQEDFHEKDVSETNDAKIQVNEEYLVPEEDVHSEFITSKSIEKVYVEEEEIKVITPEVSVQDESEDTKQREDDGSTKNDRNAKNTSGLEGWAKVVDEGVMHSLYPTTESAFILDKDQDDHRAFLASADEKREDSKELEKKCFSSKNNPLHQVITVQDIQEEDPALRRVKTISTLSKVVDTSKHNDAELKAYEKNLIKGTINEPEVLLSVTESEPDGEFKDQSPGRMKNSKTNEIDTQGSGDESITSSDSASHVVKLYRLCEKEKAPEPIFIVNQKMILGGLKYNVTCKALGLISRGSGSSVVDARRKAAKALIQKHRKISKNPSSKN